MEKKITVLKPKQGESHGLAVNQPLSSEVMAAMLPERLRIPAIKPYASTIDPMDHLDLFISHMIV